MYLLSNLLDLNLVDHKLNQFVYSHFYLIHSNTIQSSLHYTTKTETGMKEGGRMVVSMDREHTTQKERMNYN